MNSRSPFLDFLSKFIKPKSSIPHNWIDLGPTPFSETYIPQGISHDSKGVLLTSYSKFQYPHVKFFRYNGQWQELRGNCGPLVHTSGIIPYKNVFFLIDNESGIICRANFSYMSFSIEGIFQTDIKNISSAAILEHDNTPKLLVATFGLRGSYLLYDVHELMHQNTGPISPEEISPAKSFIQGNCNYCDGILQTRNGLISQPIEFAQNVTSWPIKFRKISSFPGRVVQDLTVYDGSLFTTCELYPRLYKCPLKAGVVRLTQTSL